MIARLRRVLVALGALTTSLVGCQVIVGSDVPDFQCAGADPSACPSGLVCDTNLGKCVTPSSVEPDAGDEDVAEIDAREGGADQDAPTLAELGETCVVDSDCRSRLCGTSTILTTAIVTGNTKPICTQTCCNSSNCPSGFVCFGAGTGGNYCVPAARAQRTPPTSGGKTPGQACGGNSECRSGLCADSRCLDTCCLPGECAPGTTCRVKDVAIPPPQHLIWACAAPLGGATKMLGEQCAATSECQNDNCVGFQPNRVCTPSCCSATTCTSQGFSGKVCAYGTAGTDQLKWCFDPGGGKALDETCTGNFECQSRYCDAELGRCAEVCCRDSDCSGGKRCRPSLSGTPFLRCVR